MIHRIRRRAAIPTLVVVACVTAACASRGAGSRPVLAAQPSRADRGASPSRPGQDPADKLRNAVRSLRRGLASEKAATPPARAETQSSMGDASSTPAASGTSGSWSSVEVSTPDPAAAPEPAPRTWLTMATRQLVQRDVWWSVAALIAIGAAALAWLFVRRRGNA